MRRPDGSHPRSLIGLALLGQAVLFGSHLNCADGDLGLPFAVWGTLTPPLVSIRLSAGIFPFVNSVSAAVTRSSRHFRPPRCYVFFFFLGAVTPLFFSLTSMASHPCRPSPIRGFFLFLEGPLNDLSARGGPAILSLKPATSIPPGVCIVKNPSRICLQNHPVLPSWGPLVLCTVSTGATAPAVVRSSSLRPSHLPVRQLHRLLKINAIITPFSSGFLEFSRPRTLRVHGCPRRSDFFPFMLGLRDASVDRRFFTIWDLPQV